MVKCFFLNVVTIDSKPLPDFTRTTWSFYKLLNILFIQTKMSAASHTLTREKGMPFT